MDMITRQGTLGSNLKHEGSELWHTAEEKRKGVVIEEDQDAEPSWSLNNFIYIYAIYINEVALKLLSSLRNPTTAVPVILILLLVVLRQSHTCTNHMMSHDTTLVTS